MQIVHFALGVGDGGAERMLFNILKYSKNKNIEHSVLTLGKGNFYYKQISELNVPIIELKNEKSLYKNIKRAIALLKKKDVLCCWMYHCNFLGYFLKKIFSIKKIYWNIRHSSINPKYDKRKTIFINKLCSYFSGNVDLIMYNGKKAKEVHENYGYNTNKSYVVQNGVDINKYACILNAKEKFSKNIGHDLGDKIIILSVARYHKIKDIPNFLKAFSYIHKMIPNTVAVMCGKGETEENVDLIKLINQEKIELNKDVFLLGEQKDLAVIYSAADLFILHSAAEAFPNTLIEAMSCETLCLATDVGESKKILGSNEFIAKICNAKELANIAVAMLNLNDEKKFEYKKENRKRVVEFFSIEEVVKTYESLYLEAYC